jgi:aspartate/methionine/tyrosine aminotransferase
MRLQTFEMERMQSLWENRVTHNLSESGVHAMQFGDLLDPLELRDESLGYPQTNGSPELRNLVSKLYPGSTPDQVLVTNGTAEANFLAVWNLLEPGDEMIMMVPNYMQMWGAALAFGVVPKAFHLQERHKWAPDLDELKRLISDRTKLIAICNPNNPTGAVLNDDDTKEIYRIAEKTGVWILADEIYQGAEIDGRPTSSFWGMYDRLLVSAGLSKAYGLPGLRIGWLVGPAEKIADLWRYKDYTTIVPAALSDRLAQVVLEPTKRQRILERTRSILRAQLPILESWVNNRGAVCSWVRPRAGAIGYLRYHLDVGSTALVTRLREEKSVLVVPGDQFGMDHFLRIGFGGDSTLLQEGLTRITEVLDTYPA